MKLHHLLALLVLTIMIAACGGIEPKQIPKRDYAQLADSFTRIAQQQLAANLTQAMASGGANYAVEFCNVHALPITDSLSRLFGCSIERLSNNNRNDRNAFYDEWDAQVFEVFANEGIKDTLIESSQNLYYYKPIYIAMPACLTCHGSNLDAELHALISTKYPKDKAVGYALNDLRGLWKVTFDKPQPLQ
jgi:hypothetical protein